MTLAASASTLWAGWVKDNAGFSPQQIALLLAGIPVVMAIGYAVFLAQQLKQVQKTSSQQNPQLP
jgi:hypothetical protein